jgi:hypothetical protein
LLEVEIVIDLDMGIPLTPVPHRENMKFVASHLIVEKIVVHDEAAKSANGQ